MSKRYYKRLLEAESWYHMYHRARWLGILSFSYSTAYFANAALNNFDVKNLDFIILNLCATLGFTLFTHSMCRVHKGYKDALERIIIGGQSRVVQISARRSA